MTKDEAVALAAKREKHKSKHMTHKVWLGVEIEPGNWMPRLVDGPKARATASKELRAGSPAALNVAADILLTGAKESMIGHLLPRAL